MIIKKSRFTNTKYLFKVVFGTYLLGGMHFSIDHLGGSGLYLPSNIIGWIFISILIGLGCWQIGKTTKLHYSQFYASCCLAFGLMCLPLLYTNSTYADLSLMRLLGLGGGIILYLSFKQFEFSLSERSWFLYIILGGIIIQTLYGLIQNLNPSESWNDLGFKHINNILIQKNIMSTLLVTGISISIFLLINDRNVFEKKSKLFIIYTIVFFSSILIFPLQSRTGFLALLFAIILILKYSSLRSKPIQIWTGLLILGLTIGWRSTIDPRSEQMSTYAENHRKLTYRLSFELFKNNPLTGVGYGGFLSSFRRYYAEKKQKDPSLLSIGNNNLNHPHNELLFWMVEGGILPLIGLLIIAGGFLVIIWRTRKKQSWSAFGMVFPILLHTQLELPFYISVIHWFIFLYLIFYIDEEYGINKVSIIKFSFYPYVAAFIIPAIIIFYMSTALQTAMIITKYERKRVKDPELLLLVKNSHAWKKKYETLAMSLHLDISKTTNDHEKIKEYVEWAEDYIRHSPYLFIYYDLATAYQALGDKEKAWHIYRHCQYLYPGTKWRDEPITK